MTRPLNTVSIWFTVRRTSVGYSRPQIMASTATHLESLNNAQRKAAGFGEPVAEGPLRAGPLLIIAGAGTGKTNTLAHRVAHLVLSGALPERILLLTFTRRAALEMTRRTQRILGERGLTRVPTR